MVCSQHLLVIGDRAPLGWILREERMAFATHRAKEAASLDRGSRLFIYTTRGCFHNPTRDRGRVIGLATALARVEPLPEVVRFGDRVFPLGVQLKIDGIAQLGEGIVLAEFITRMDAFPDPTSWSARMRRTLVPLSSADAEMIEAAVAPVLRPPHQAIPSYLERIPVLGP